MPSALTHADDLDTATLLDALRETDALLEGHFILSSGLHSAQYVQCARLLAWPRRAGEVGRAIARRVQSEAIDVVVGPALGGILVAHEVASALDVRCLFAERSNGELALRRGFEIQPGERALICEDVVTTGGSARETAALVERLGGVVVGYAAIVDRSSSGDGSSMPGADRPLHALCRQPIETYAPESCPLCASGSPAIKPGSRR